VEALRRCTRIVAVLAATLALPAASAHAVVEPPQIVGGASSKWISGDLLQQTGLNCSTAILGSSYTEVMVSGIASYGGLQSVPKVGDAYWTGFLVSIPGNPCGTGSSSVVTTLVMPPNTQVDSSRQIRCFGLSRNATPTTPWEDLTNASWNFLNQSGPYCASQPSISPYHQGGLQFGFRPLANGQMFWIFVPVKSTAQLVGAQHSPPDGFYWLTDATGVYANPGLSTVWANVFPAGGGGDPYVYFARDPTNIPFWKEDSPNDPANGNITTKSRAEWFANMYSAGKTGTFCWELYYGSPPSTVTPAQSSCPPSSYPGWNGAIDTSGDLWQVFGSGGAAGPNGGYAPFYYDDDPPSTTFTVRWKFLYNDPGPKVISKDSSFTTLAGPDQDGDGVANNGTDACPTVKGTLPNGCLPAVQDDPDKDGVYGANDKCPNLDGQGALNGCPGGIVPIVPIPPKPDVLTGILTVKKGALFKKKTLAKGAPVKFSCTVDSTAKGALSITKKTATKLGIKTKKKQKTVGIAAGKGTCTKAAGGSLKLKLARAYAKKVKRARKKFAATLSVKLTAPNQTPVTMKQPVKVG
jgi:hypothetical protein